MLPHSFVPHAHDMFRTILRRTAANRTEACSRARLLGIGIGIENSFKNRDESLKEERILFWVRIYKLSMRTCYEAWFPLNRPPKPSPSTSSCLLTREYHSGDRYQLLKQPSAFRLRGIASFGNSNLSLGCILIVVEEPLHLRVFLYTQIIII